MSLTSYRAAPPRASVNPFGIYRVRVNPLGLLLLPEQIARRRFAPARDAPCFRCLTNSFCSAFRPLESRKDRFGRPFCFGLGRFRSEKIYVAFSRPGSDRLSRVLRRSTIGAGAFHGRVRNGNGCSRPAITTRSAKRNFEKLVRPVRPRF